MNKQERMALSNVQSLSHTDGFSAIDFQTGVRSITNTPFKQTRNRYEDNPLSENIISFPYEEETMNGNRTQMINPEYTRSTK